jgi:hypothetical protein
MIAARRSLSAALQKQESEIAAIDILLRQIPERKTE